MLSVDTIKEELADRAGQTFTAAVRSVMNEESAAGASEKARERYRGLPADALADVLIKRARRKTKWEGAANGLGVTGAEVITPAQPVVGVSSVAALLLADIAWVTKVQTQLVLEVAHVYGVPFSREDEEDLWTVFKAALGLKGTERAVTYTRFVATETARKQFRKFLRTGVRRELQKRVTKWAGQRVGRYLAEKYVMRLIPLANAGIGYKTNDLITKKVGYWAKVKAKIRAGSAKHVDRLLAEEPTAAPWALPIVYWVGTAHVGDLTDNFLTHYTHTQKRLDLDEPSLCRVEELVNDDELSVTFAAELPKLQAEASRQALYRLAVLTAAVNLKADAAQEDAVAQVAEWLGIDHKPRAVSDRIRDLKR